MMHDFAITAHSRRLHGPAGGFDLAVQRLPFRWDPDAAARSA